MATLRSLACTGALLTLGCPNPPATPSACADVPLRIGADLARPRDYGFPPGVRPVVTIDLRLAATTARTEVTVEACDGSARTTRSFDGTRSFDLDPSWYAAVANVYCHRISAVARNHSGFALGSATARVRFGGFTVQGDVMLRDADPKRPSQPARARVEVQHEKLTLSTVTDDAGRFRLDFWPPGRVLRVRAQAIGGDAQLAPSADLAPAATLDSAHPSLPLHLVLERTPPVVDAYEPDDTLDRARVMPALAAGATQLHALATPKDVDYIPFAGQDGRTYLARLSPIPRGDFIVEILDRDGNHVTSANDKPGDFQPAPSLKFSVSGNNRVYVKVSRNDAEPQAKAYRLRVSQIGGAP